MQTLTYKYRLLPTRSQHLVLREILEAQRQLYNGALEHRIECYRKTGHSPNRAEQSRELTICRKEIPSMAALSRRINGGTLQRLDEAFKHFFRRVRAGEKPGFPRFRGRGWFSCFTLDQWMGFQFRGSRLYFRGMPSGLRVHFDRPLPDTKILTAWFKQDHKGWVIGLVIEAPCAEKRGVINRAIGIDVGLEELVATSDGLLISNPRHAKRVEQELRRRNRSLSRCKRNSKHRAKVRKQLTRLYAKVRNTRDTKLHQIASMLVNQNDMIAVEALNIKNMVRGTYAKGINDAGWGKLRRLLCYKAERAGVHFIEVDPRYTSQTCPNCGVIKKKTRDERVHLCPCSCALHRDTAAAQIVLQRGIRIISQQGVAVLWPGNVVQ